MDLTRKDTHVGIAGALNGVYALVRGLTLLGLGAVFVGMGLLFVAVGVFEAEGAPVVFGTFFTVFGLIIPLIAGLPLIANLVACIGMCGRYSWGPVAAIIAAVLSLTQFPTGMALGGYTLLAVVVPDKKPAT